jgi:hypothetical protein
MSVLTDDEKKKIEEEEKTRVHIRLQCEQKSSGLAGVLSSIIPGLGQVYNGQMGKASFFISIILISLLILTAGIIFQIKGMPTRESPIPAIEESEPVEINEEGVIIEDEIGQEGETEQQNEKKPALPVALIILGLIGTVAGWNYSVKDAVNTAKRINSSY